ncbi:MAG TPA: Ig-like domain-containing protein, partial [Acidobacteriota bacterium]|nr:Ig-like domain-containing protein [Acidobacteriota bacterium]
IFQNLEDTLLIRNNLFLDFVGLPAIARWGDESPTTGPVTLVHNAYWPPVDSFYMAHRYEDPWVVHVIDSGNFNGFPMLTDDSLYRLQMASPLIDAGDRSVLDVDGSRSDVGWTGGPEGVSYEYPDLAPHSPELLWPEGESTRVTVLWHLRPEADLGGYHLYRGTSRGFSAPGVLPPPIAELGDGDTSYTEILPLDPDTVYYAVTAFDTVGLESAPSDERAYAISRGTNHPPVVPPSYGRTISEGQSIRFELIATDPDGDRLFFVADPLPENAVLTDHGDGTATFDFHPDYSQSGYYEVEVIVSDGMLADTALIRVGVNERNGPPQLAPIDAQTVVEAGELTVAVTASDPDGDSVILSAEDVPVNGSFVDHGDGTGTFAFSPDTTQAAVYTVRLIASDGQKADTLELAVTVTEPGSPSLPRTPRIVRSYPNPFNSATLIEVYVPDAGASPAPVELHVYDIVGRHVGTIFDGTLAPGTHTVPWNGTGDGNRSLASGVYFVRLKVWSRVFGSGHKIVLLK